MLLDCATSEKQNLFYTFRSVSSCRVMVLPGEGKEGNKRVKIKKEERKTTRTRTRCNNYVRETRWANL